MRRLDLPSSKLRNKAKNISYEGVLSPTLLVSNWSQRAESPVYDYYYDQNGYLLNAPVEDSIYDKDINAARKRANKYKMEEVSPLYHAPRYDTMSISEINAHLDSLTAEGGDTCL